MTVWIRSYLESELRSDESGGDRGERHKRFWGSRIQEKPIHVLMESGTEERGWVLREESVHWPS